MKQNVLFILLLVTSICSAQSLVQSVNSGSLIASNTAVSVGEIVVNPVNSGQSSSGLIGILAQINNPLEVANFEVAQNVVAFPNPTTASISFEGKNLSGEKLSVYGNSGQLVLQTEISASNSIDLSGLSAGIYLIEFSDAKNKSFKIIKH